MYFKNQRRTRDDTALLVGESRQNMVCGNIKFSANLELVRDLLPQLEECKSMGLNGLHPRLLQELSDVLARLLSNIFQQSRQSGGLSGLEADKCCNI